ncbi:MAG: N-acyl-D-amino-acid deacylase family protein [Armatimonadota bacterium]
MLDILIKNGFIVDGSGLPGYVGDIGILGEQICIGNDLPCTAKRVLNADGLAVSPGFIDIHSHTDHLVFANPTCESKVTQGVTTEVSGNCGESAAPRGGLHCDESMCDWGPDHGVVPDWKSMGEFFDKLGSLPMSINFATYVGHGTIRGVVMGYDDRDPTTDEMASMRSLVRDAMDAGAFGLSSGLVYPPGCFSKTDELVALCKVVAEYNGIYSTHIRNEAAHLIDAVDEAIRIGAESGVSVQLAHHKACGMMAKGSVERTLEMIDDARRNGIDVWADQYPYSATCTGLSSILPHWAHDGGNDALMARLSDAGTSCKIRDYLITEATGSGRIADTGGWDSIVVNQIYGERNSIYEGFCIREIADTMHIHPADTVLKLLLEEKSNVGIIHFMIDEEDIRQVMRHPNILIGSDSTARSTTGVLSNGKPHPRAFGTFPRVLGKYSRNEQLLPLEESVSKMTGRTAERLGLRKRGFIRDGYFADLVIFNPSTIIDRADYSNPHRYADGIIHVMVNGNTVCEDGIVCEIRKSSTGKILRRGIE